MKMEKIKERIEEVKEKIEKAKEEKDAKEIEKHEQDTILAMRVKLCYDRGMTVEECAEICDMKVSQIKMFYMFIRRDWIDWTGCDFTTVSI